MSSSWSSLRFLDIYIDVFNGVWEIFKPFLQIFSLILSLSSWESHMSILIHLVVYHRSLGSVHFSLFSSDMRISIVLSSSLLFCSSCSNLSLCPLVNFLFHLYLSASEVVFGFFLGFLALYYFHFAYTVVPRFFNIIHSVRPFEF